MASQAFVTRLAVEVGGSCGSEFHLDFNVSWIDWKYSEALCRLKGLVLAICFTEFATRTLESTQCGCSHLLILGAHGLILASLLVARDNGLRCCAWRFGASSWSLAMGFLIAPNESNVLSKLFFRYAAISNYCIARSLCPAAR